MSDILDELTGKLENGVQIDPNSLGAHPRYSQFKNLSKAAEQQAKRRQDLLDRQKEGRFEKLLRLRNLALDESDSDCDDEKQEEAVDMSEIAGRRMPCRSKYADQLMLSEWLVDIPEALSDQWTMVAAPHGKRCLVVAAKGITTVYNKGGRVIAQFASKLPGGSRKGYTFTILDCIRDQNSRTYYILDLLSWNEREYADNPFDFRRFMLQSKIEENPELGEPNNKHQFVISPSCPCSKEEMRKMMEKPFDFQLAGLLFYHNSVIYEAGQSPLVGWLKPWMLPEILGVPVCETYKSEGNPFKDSKQFIDKFNKKYGHRSQIEKQMDEG